MGHPSCFSRVCELKLREKPCCEKFKIALDIKFRFNLMIFDISPVATKLAYMPHVIFSSFFFSGQNGDSLLNEKYIKNH